MSPGLPLGRALLSVADKTGIVEFAHQLSMSGVQLIATGGTARILQNAHIPLTLVEDITCFPEMMDGRVKTLHPMIHGGILGLRDKHQQQAMEHDIDWIDLVVVNLYPFQETVQQTDDCEAIIEQIDIGGPTLLRAAAKNHAWVTVTHDPKDYELIIATLQTGGPDLALRKKLATKAFAHTAKYDTAIASFLGQEDPLQSLHNACSNTTKIELRYGENPHQKAFLYTTQQKNTALGYGVAHATLIQGKELSYNNYVDVDAALTCCQEFSNPAAVIVKHTNPCGVAVAEHIDEAFQHAFNADSQSAFGGVVALNRPCSAAIAKLMTEIFFEVIVAPSIDEKARAIFAKKPNLRVLELTHSDTIKRPWQTHCISGGILVQETDNQSICQENLHCVTTTQPNQRQLEELLIAWHVVKHLKSNAIAIIHNKVSIGLSGGQVSRIAALKHALTQADHFTEGAVLASDAFFPFRDSIDALRETGIRAIIQPGGSIRDQEIIAACNEYQISMIFTGIRSFNH